MSDDKQKTRAKLLNELESIKDLLHEEDGFLDIEPPLLTTAIDDVEDAPLLTEVLEEPSLGDGKLGNDKIGDEALGHTVPEDEALADEDIPLLQEAIEPINAEKPAVQEPEPEQPAGEPAPVENEPVVDDVAVVEEQQSLFPTTEGEPVEAGESPAVDRADNAEAERRAEAEQSLMESTSRTLSSGRGENPFLPKHIRDRLTANRKNQTAMMESLAPLARPAPAPAPKPAAVRLPDEQQLIDELVQRFLPEIEAALRERLQALLRDTAEPTTSDSDD